MEFVALSELSQELKSRGVVDLHPSSERHELTIDPARKPVCVILGQPDASAPREGFIHVPCPDERLTTTLEVMLHKLHVTPIYAIPVGRWREIFDIVSFGLAAHDAWQEIDAQASVEQNTRDALVCGPRDLHMLRELARVLWTDGDPGHERALTLIAVGQGLIARVEPKKCVRITVGSTTVAEQLRDAAVHFLNGSAHHA